jgi:O-antigen ligase
MNPAGIATLIILGGGLLYIIVNEVNILDAPASRPYLAFLAISFFTLLLTPGGLGGISDWIRLVSIFVIYILVLNLFNTEEKINKLLQAILISVIVPSAVGFYQFLTGTGNQSVYGFNRIFATFIHPNPYAFYLTMLLPMGIVLLFKDGSSSRKIILGILCTAMGISLILTYTRAAWIAVFLAILLLGTFRYRKLLIISVPLIFLLIKFDPFLVGRLGDVFESSSYYDSQNSFLWRIKYWSEVIPLILSRPILGHGLSSFSFYSRGWAAHNDYLRVAFETGFIGLGAYLWILVSLLRRAIYVYKRIGVQYFKSLTLGFISIFIAYITIMLSDNLMRSLVVQWYFWIFAGIAFSLYKVDTERAQKESRKDV